MIATKVNGRMGPGTERRGPLPRRDHDADRREPEAPRHRLRRPLPDPPVRPDGADRGDDGGAARRREERQGPLHRRLVDVDVAVRRDAAHRRHRGAHPVRVDAGPVLAAHARGGAGDAAVLPRDRRRRDPVVAARPRAGSTRDWDDDDGPQRHRRVRQDAVQAGGGGRPADRRGRRTRSRRTAGVSRAQVALAWVLAQPAVTAPIVGATKPRAPRRRRRGRAARPEDDELEALEAEYVPHTPTGF